VVRFKYAIGFIQEKKMLPSRSAERNCAPMKTTLLLVSGALVLLATFALFYLFNAYACGMNPTGCRGFVLNWDDWETLRFLAPTFLLGMALLIAGTWRLLTRRPPL
tara:strand:- start:510 stop:827 length:318 start_codon:yes stop_codon:yes gene_type:complete